MQKIEILYECNLKLTELSYLNETGFWRFTFGNHQVGLDTFSFWRLMKDGKPWRISTDQNLKYTYSKPPINLVNELKGILCDIYLIKIERNIKTGDLFFIFEKEYSLEVLTYSMTMENWDLSINHKLYTSLPGGELS